MTLKIKSRTAQYPLVAEFTFNFNDTMVNTAGNTVDFGLTNLGGAAGSFDVIPSPPGAVITGGEVVRSTAFDTASYAVVVGDSVTANRYLASTDLKGLGRTALVPTGYVSLGNDLRIGITNADVFTTGVCTVRIEYVVAGRATENQIS